MTFIELQPGDIVEVRRVGVTSRFDCITRITQCFLFVGEERFLRTNGRPATDKVVPEGGSGIFIPEALPADEAKLQLAFRLYQIASRWENIRDISNHGLRKLAECFIEERLDTKQKTAKTSPVGPVLAVYRPGRYYGRSAAVGCSAFVVSSSSTRRPTKVWVDSES